MLADHIRGLAAGEPVEETYSLFGEAIHYWITHDIACRFHKYDVDSPREVFMEVMKRIAKSPGTIVKALDGGVAPQAYIWGMAENAAKDRNSKLDRLARVNQQLPEGKERGLSLWLNVRDLLSVDERLIADERLSLINRALRKMPLRDQELLILSLADEKPRQIAARLGMKVGDVRKQLKSAWGRLKTAARKEGAK